MLNEVSEGSRAGSEDLVRTFEVWRKTGSRRAEALLRKQGVVPLPDKKHRH